MVTKPSTVVHLCDNELNVSDYLQVGTNGGSRVLIIGEAPAPNGWRISGRAFYTPAGRLLPSGVRLNLLLAPFDLSVETAYFTELVKCFVGSQRSLLRSCAAKTFDLLKRQIDLASPALIILLGKATHETLERCVGRTLPFGEIYSLTINGTERSMLSIFHPSPISPTSQSRNQEIFEKLTPKITKLLREAT